jgi:hypothetical protein
MYSVPQETKPSASLQGYSIDPWSQPNMFLVLCKKPLFLYAIDNWAFKGMLTGIECAYINFGSLTSLHAI